MQPSPLLPSSRTFASPETELIRRLFPIPSSPRFVATTQLLSVLMDLPCLDTSQTWDDTLCGPLGLASFTRHNVSKARAHSGACQRRVPCDGGLVSHCTDRPRSIHPCSSNVEVGFLNKKKISRGIVSIQYQPLFLLYSSSVWTDTLRCGH